MLRRLPKKTVSLNWHKLALAMNTGMNLQTVMNMRERKKKGMTRRKERRGVAPQLLCTVQGHSQSGGALQGGRVGV